MSQELQTLTANSFDSRIGEKFEVAIGDAEVILGLTEVTKLGSGERDGGAFALVFEGPQEPLFPQGIYSLVEAAGERSLDLFLVPINQTKKASFYEAVFT